MAKDISGIPFLTRWRSVCQVPISDDLIIYLTCSCIPKPIGTLAPSLPIVEVVLSAENEARFSHFRLYMITVCWMTSLVSYQSLLDTLDSINAYLTSYLGSNVTSTTPKRNGISPSEVLLVRFSSLLPYWFLHCKEVEFRSSTGCSLSIFQCPSESRSKACIFVCSTTLYRLYKEV